jgi:adenine-specific DNA-methyltransferase
MKPEKIERRSSNEERLGVLRDLFPEVFADGRVNVERLREVLEDSASDVSDSEHYGLRWPGKEKARRLANQPPHATLRPVPNAGVDEETTGNMLIVGDNLQVLLALQKSYANSIKLVYIDPPYNTGNDFIYKDNFVIDEALYLEETRQADLNGRLVSNPQTSGRFHSNWLNFMYPRLRVARSLLRPDGVIGIHIDEHELENLVLMCKEIFGEENYLGTAVWDKGNPKGDATAIAYQHESIVLFGNNVDALSALQRAKPNAKRMLDEARQCLLRSGGNMSAAREGYSSWVKTTSGLSGGEAMYSRLDEAGRVYRLVSMAWPNKKQAPEDYFRPLVHPTTKLKCPVPERGWRNPPATMERLLAEGLIEFGVDHTVQPQRRYFLDENMYESIPSVLKFAGSDDALLRDLGIPFDHPKPVAFSSQLIEWLTKPDDLVLDCFAGSGTTGHATWLASRESGNRRFILVQVDSELDAGGASNGKQFSNLAEITCERLRRVSKALKADGAKGDLGFRVFKEDSPALARPPHLAAEQLQKGNLELFKEKVAQVQPTDHFTEVLLLLGFPLDTKREQVPQDSANTLWRFEHPRVAQPLLLCLDQSIDDNLLHALTTRKNHTFVCRDEALTDVAKARFYDALKLADSTFKVL